jgi:acetyl esterase
MPAVPSSDPDPLELVALLGGDEPEGESLAETRVRYERDAVRLFGAPPPVHEVRDLVVPGPAGDVPCRLYQPDPEPALGCVVFCHGGGWMIGSLASHDGVCRALARRSHAAVLSVDYRMAPEAPYPAAIDDAAAALAHAPGSAVVVAGDSAGGNLAAALALRARAQGVDLAGQLLLYPALDPSCATPSFDLDPVFPPNREAMLAYWDAYLGAAAGDPPTDAAPALACDLAGLAPALVITGEYDPLRDDGERYAEQLRAAGVDVRHRRFAGMVHGFMRVPSIAAWHEAMDLAAGFVRERLAAGPRVNPV